MFEKDSSKGNEELFFPMIRGRVKMKSYVKQYINTIENQKKLRKDQIDDAETATSIHRSVGKEVREAIEKIGVTMPEDLPTPEKSIAQIEKEQMELLRQKAKNGQLMLDE